MITEKIDHFLKLIPELTKDEADLIDQVCQWDNETRTAYTLAKNIFDEYLEEKENQ